MEFQTTRIENKDLCNVLLKWVRFILHNLYYFVSRLKLPN